MSEDWYYPQDVANNKRIYLRVTAWEYSAPSLPAREAAGDIYNGVSIEKGEKLFTFSTYVPGGFGDSVNASWDDSESVVFSGSAKKIDFAGDISKQLLSHTDNIGKRLIAGAAQRGALKAADAIGASLGGLKIKEGVESSFGVTIQPNSAKVFTSNSSRQMDVNVRFVPRNSDESSTMKSVIAAFRNASTSVLVPQTEGMLNIYRYPAVYDISIINPALSVSSNNFISYKSMVCTNYKVSYSDSQELLTWFTDGSPTDATLSMSFISIYPAFRRADKPIDSNSQ